MDGETGESMEEEEETDVGCGVSESLRRPASGPGDAT